MYVWVVSLMHANGRFEPKSAHFNEDEARWTVGSLAGTPGSAVSLARVRLMDYGQADNTTLRKTNVAPFVPARGSA